MKFRKTSSFMTHEQAWILLPWYVNGTLDADERRLVEQHLQGCGVCRKEQSEILKQSAYCRQTAIPELSAQASFNRLMQRIESESTGSRGKNASPRGMPEFYRQLMQSLSVLLPPKPAAAALAVMLLAVPAVILLMPGISQAPDTEYRTLSSSRGLESSVTDTIHVIFAESVDRKERLRILASIHGAAIAEPNARGVYLIQIAPLQGSKPDIAQAIAALRREAGVLFAEPASPPDASFAMPDGQL
jgi:anti-sigma factor RsiW